MIAVYELSAGGGLSLAASGRLAGGAMRWVRLVAPSPQELQEAFRAFGPALAEIDAGDQGRVVTREQMLLMRMPVHALEWARALPLRIGCTPDTLITAEEQALPAIDLALKRWLESQRLGWTLAELFIELLEAAAGSSEATYLALRRRSEELAESVERNPVGVAPQALLAMRRPVADL